MSKAHLAIACEALTPASAASEQAKRLATGFAERGYRVSLLAGKAFGAQVDDRVQLYSAGLRSPGTIKGIMRLRRWHAQQLAALKPDRTLSLTTLLPAEVLMPLEGTAAGLRDSLRHQAAPLPIRAASWLQSLKPGVMLRGMVEKRSLADPTLRTCVALTPIIEAQLHKVTTAEHVQIEHVALPDSSSAISAASSQGMRDRVARGLDLPGDVPWLVFPFRSAWADGIEPMVLAFKVLVDWGSDAVLLLAGPSKYTHLAWLGQLGLRDRVRFVGTPDEPEPLYAACDLVVQPTSYDPGGWGVRPVIACGRPVVTTEASGAAELVRQSGGAVIQAPADPQSLLEALQQRLEGLAPGQAAASQDDPAGSAAAFVDVIEALLCPESTVSGD